MQLKYTGKLYLEVDGEKTVGPGRVELLEKIREHGSIRKAAQEMNMSYRQAWQAIDHLNNRFTEPLVVINRGGAGGGKAVVTAKGELVISEFRDFHARFKQFLQEESDRLKRLG